MPQFNHFAAIWLNQTDKAQSMKDILTVLIFLASIICLWGQNVRPNQERFSIHIKRATERIVLDGLLNEASWQRAEIATDFWQKTPRDDVRAVAKTEVKVTYDDQMLYVAGICYGTSDWVVPTLKRDEFWDGDGFAVILDPLNEATTGYMFGTNIYGSQTDVLLGGGSGSSNYNGEWDNRWYVETNVETDRWTFEIAIPFKTLRFEAGKSVWGINFARNDKQGNYLDIWAQMPRNFWVIDLGYTGKMIWDQAPSKIKGGNIALIPYVTTDYYEDAENDQPAEMGFAAGGDAKIALTSSLNLDLTLNPDFSQVEVDRQVTNLTRFSIFLPERRTFFLENSDIFSGFGIPPVRPFFSRRIGLDEGGNQVPILYGARLTGNVTSSTRVGLLNVQTLETDDQLAQNYTAASFNQRVLGRSTIKGMFINRQSMDEGSFVSGDYGRNASLEFNYQSVDGAWQGWSGYHHSFTPLTDNNNQFWNIGGSYSGKVFSTTLDFVTVGKNYYADVGFVNFLENYDAEKDETIRLGYRLIFFPLEWTFVPKNSNFINSHGFQIENLINLDFDYNLVERSHEMGYSFEFKNSSSFSISAALTETDLRFPFSFTDGVPLPTGRYQYNSYGMEYSSDERKLLQYGFFVGSGAFYNGDITSAGGFVLFRRQPWGNFGMEVEYNGLQFPEEFGQETIWAFSPRAEINFNRNLFWTTFFQYNTQLNRFNINSRLQWRFAPMSDIFLVYTDNSSVDPFTPINKALVFKMNYWLVL